MVVGCASKEDVERANPAASNGAYFIGSAPSAAFDVPPYRKLRPSDPRRKFANLATSDRPSTCW
jgi:hypothetical protein